MAALLDGDDMVTGQLVDHLVQHPAVEAGGMHQPQRGRSAAQRGAPFEAGQRQPAEFQVMQFRLMAHAPC